MSVRFHVHSAADHDDGIDGVGFGGRRDALHGLRPLRELQSLRHARGALGCYRHRNLHLQLSRRRPEYVDGGRIKRGGISRGGGVLGSFCSFFVLVFVLFRCFSYVGMYVGR